MPSQDLELIVLIFLTTVYSLCFAGMITPHLPFSGGWGLQKISAIFEYWGRNTVARDKIFHFQAQNPLLLVVWFPGWDGRAQGDGNLKFGGLGGYLVQGSAEHELCQYWVVRCGISSLEVPATGKSLWPRCPKEATFPENQPG